MRAVIDCFPTNGTTQATLMGRLGIYSDSVSAFSVECNIKSFSTSQKALDNVRD